MQRAHTRTLDLDGIAIRSQKLVHPGNELSFYPFVFESALVTRMYAADVVDFYFGDLEVKVLDMRVS